MCTCVLSIQLNFYLIKVKRLKAKGRLKAKVAQGLNREEPNLINGKTALGLLKKLNL